MDVGNVTGYGLYASNLSIKSMCGLKRLRTVRPCRRFNPIGGSGVSRSGNTVHVMIFGQLCCPGEAPSESFSSGGEAHYELIRGRLDSGYSVEEAVDEDFSSKHRPGPEGKEVWFDGVAYGSLKELAEALPCSYASLLQKHKKYGGTAAFSDAVKRDLRPERRVVYEGREYKSLKAVCSAYSLPYNEFCGFKKRHNGMPDAEVIDVFREKQATKYIEYRGRKYANYKEIYHAYPSEVSCSTFLRRIKKGYSIDEALTFGKREKNDPYTYNGVTYRNFAECCRAHGVNLRTAQNRLKMGRTPDEIFSPRTLHHEPVEYDGKVFGSFGELCRFYGVDEKITYSRWKYSGWTLERALTEPVTKGKRVVYKGKEYGSLSALCRETGAKYDRVKGRVLNGHSVEEAIETESLRTDIGVTYNGVEYPSMRTCCLENGKDYKFVHHRLTMGWSFEDAMNLPPGFSNIPHEGETAVSTCGLKMTLGMEIAPARYDIEFEDGTKTTGLRRMFLKGLIMHPDLKCGPRISDFAGFTARWIGDYKGKTFYNCTCKECELRDVLTPQQMLEHHKQCERIGDDYAKIS